MGELFRNDYFVVEHRQGEPFIRVVRTRKAYPSVADTAAAVDEVSAALKSSVVRRVLMDLRGGPPGRNDPQFEEATQRWRRDLGKTFERRAVLVKSAVGKLQVQRLNGGADQIVVTQDENEAVRFLS
jgi:hypothetical protein